MRFTKIDVKSETSIFGYIFVHSKVKFLNHL